MRDEGTPANEVIRCRLSGIRTRYREYGFSLMAGAVGGVVGLAAGNAKQSKADVCVVFEWWLVQPSDKTTICCGITA